MLSFRASSLFKSTISTLFRHGTPCTATSRPSFSTFGETRNRPLNRNGKKRKDAVDTTQAMMHSTPIIWFRNLQLASYTYKWKSTANHQDLSIFWR
mmetsp:Transcript_25650/g.42974  ORF Transcript_25650/g.42974 Transcript_25650/m.42974 type:complete len:96 (+) Transcript_25650:67-354(+)